MALRMSCIVSGRKHETLRHKSPVAQFVIMRIVDSDAIWPTSLAIDGWVYHISSTARRNGQLPISKSAKPKSSEGDIRSVSTDCLTRLHHDLEVWMIADGVEDIEMREGWLFEAAREFKSRNHFDMASKRCRLLWSNDARNDVPSFLTWSEKWYTDTQHEQKPVYRRMRKYGFSVWAASDAICT